MKKVMLHTWVTLLMIQMIATDAWANRIQQAAVRAQSELYSIGGIAVSIGILLGGILLGLGFPTIGKVILTSGAIGAIAVFGGQAFLDVLSGIFP